MATKVKAITIIDPEGKEWPMFWDDALAYDMVNWCAFCDQTITEGWVYEPDDLDEPLLILCAACADWQKQA